MVEGREDTCVCGHARLFHLMGAHRCCPPGGGSCTCKKFRETTRCYKCYCNLGKNDKGFIDGLQRPVCKRCLEEDEKLFSDGEIEKWIDWEDVDPVNKEDLLKRYEKILKSNKQDEINKIKKKIIEVFGFAP